MRKVISALIALGLAVTGLVAVGSTPAYAAPCTIPPSPGAYIYDVNLNSTDRACFKVFKDYVSPSSFWENFYIDEIVDYGDDSGCVRLYLRIVGWTSWRHVGTDCESSAWTVVSGYSYWSPIPSGVYAKIDAKVEFRNSGGGVTATVYKYDVANIDF